MKRLYRSSTNTIVGGILGGVGEYLSVDPTIVRLVYLVLALLTGIIPAVVVYLIALLIVPRHTHEPSTPPQHGGDT